jgi:hypothetical protein
MSDILARRVEVLEQLAPVQPDAEAAFADCYTRCFGRIAGQVTAVTGDAAEAEDLTQEAFLRCRRAEVRRPLELTLAQFTGITERRYLLGGSAAAFRAYLDGGPAVLAS